ncbi:MAG: hypothetical protein Q4G68_02530 [Planctomycetia bacterium]|nr:hypothetical protein [Planctomycetia bacterium]
MKRQIFRSLLTTLCCCCVYTGLLSADEQKTEKFVRISSTETLPGTALFPEGKTVEDIVPYQQMDPFINSQLEKAKAVRAKNWTFTGTTRESFAKFIDEKRFTFSKIAGTCELRVHSAPPMSPVSSVNKSAQGEPVCRDIKWSVFDDYAAEGIMIEPAADSWTRTEIVVPHAGMMPIDFYNRLPYLQKIAKEGNCRIIIPAIVGREKTRPGNGRGPMCARHYLNWTAFEVGHHIIGYEVQSVIALVDWLKDDPATSDKPIRVAGYGDGGLTAFYAGVLDNRIDEVFLSGHFNTRDNQWQEPQDRNVFGLLNNFCDAELAVMMYPRPLYIEAGRGPVVVIDYPPANMQSPDPVAVQNEIERAKALLPDFLGDKNWIHLVTDNEKNTLGSYTPDEDFSSADSPEYQRQQQRIIRELDYHNRNLLAESKFERMKFMSKLDFSSIEAYEKSTEFYRNYYYETIIGKFDEEFTPFNAQTRKTYDEEKWVGYDVLIDVFPGLSVGGILHLPKDLKPGEKRPVVVFQHGKGGKFDSSLFSPAYKSIPSTLANNGYIVFSCQGMYPLEWFRVPCRKANCIGKSLYSFIIPQHMQLLKWLKTLPYVQGDRIGFYGLSYGGRSAVRVPSAVTDYCLSIASADFTNWAVRAASPREPFSFVGTREYETNDFNLANTFSHAEMASLIAPRPFMVERGFFDLCGDSECVGSEYAKVKFLYDAKLKLPERTRIDWFVGGHEIHAVGTLEFLKKHLCDNNNNTGDTEHEK